MRVALVGPYPLPGATLEGGTERVIECLAGALQRSMEVVIIVPGSQIDSTVSKDGVQFLYLRRGKLPGFLRYWRADARDVAKAVEKVSPDVVHFHCGAGTSRYVRQPSIVTVHGILSRDIVESSRGRTPRYLLAHVVALFLAVVERWYRRKVGNVIVISPYMRAVLPDLQHLNTFDIPNPVNARFLSTNVTQKRTRLLVAVQRIGPLKNTLDLVRVAVEAFQVDESARLVICGTASDLSYLRACENLVKEARLENRILFLGRQSTEAVAELLSAATCYVTMTRQETSPMAVAEALCCGAAVIGPRDFGFTTMIDQGVNGFFWPDTTSERVALLLQCLAHDWRHSAIAQSARKEYEPRRVAERTVDAYRQVISASSR